MSFTTDFVSELGEKLAAGGHLSGREAEALMRSADLLSLGMLADDLRRRRHGDRATFVRVAELSASGHAGADARVPAHAKEVRIVGTPASSDDAVAAVRAAAGAAGSRPVTGFALNDLDEQCGRNRQALVAALRRLREAGLAMVSELILDRTDAPERLCGAAADAGLAIARATIAKADSCEAFELLRGMQAWATTATPIRALAPLSRQSDTPLSTGFDDVRQVALGRVLASHIASIQIDWSLHGPKLAQVALAFGADDLDRVPPVDLRDLGPRRAPLEEVRRNIRSAGFRPVERDGRFVTSPS